MPKEIFNPSIPGGSLEPQQLFDGGGGGAGGSSFDPQDHKSVGRTPESHLENHPYSSQAFRRRFSEFQIYRSQPQQFTVFLRPDQGTKRFGDNKPSKKTWPPTWIGFGALGVVMGSMIGSTEVAVGGMVVGGALGRAIDVYVDSRTKKSGS